MVETPLVNVSGVSFGNILGIERSCTTAYECGRLSEDANPQRRIERGIVDVADQSG
jgi:hypothetical protein